MRAAMMWTLAAAIVLLPLYGNAQTPSSKAGSGGKTLSEADKKFMMKAASGGKAEVELGRLATDRGSAKVKEFGQRMVTDHGKANDELAQLAQEKGITLRADPDKKHKQLMDRLSKLSGPDFDRAYAQEMQRDHDADVKEFQREAQSAKDADLKAWAAKTLPVLQEHQRHVHELTASIGIGAARPSGSSK